MDFTIDIDLTSDDDADSRDAIAADSCVLVEMDGPFTQEQAALLVKQLATVVANFVRENVKDHSDVTVCT